MPKSLPLRLKRTWQALFQISMQLRPCERGAIYAEYITLVVLVTLIAALLVAGLGIPLVRQYDLARTILLAPIP
ncbi:MAG: hypothetical protein IPJ88_04370 [Myxococcales bacterium]|nr:MAG: hypothetical protein IPJ88_04370 [Myxococcales bacterium]